MYASTITQTAVMTDSERQAWLLARHERENRPQESAQIAFHSIVAVDKEAPAGTKSWAACCWMRSGALQIFVNKTREVYHWLHYTPEQVLRGDFPSYAKGL